MQRAIYVGLSIVLAVGLSISRTERVVAQAMGTMQSTPSISTMSTMSMMSAPPKEGAKAPDFALTGINGAMTRLSTEVTRGPVVLVVLRGWPGYQCPFCTRQFGEYMSRVHELEATGAEVLFVYPGPAAGLKDHAVQFMGSARGPRSYRILLDPDYAFTNAYGLRWNEPGETAYPSTFVIGKDRVVAFARTSRQHGDRVPVADVLAALGRVKR